MKPKLGKVIYTIYNGNITKTKVEYLGKDSFLTEEFRTYTFGYEYEYENYNINWFTSLAKAKKSVIETLEEEDKKKVRWRTFDTKDYWELVDKGEFKWRN